MPLDLRIDLQPKQGELQRLCRESQHTVLGFGGPKGGGKSGVCRRIMLQRRLEHPGTNGAIIRRVYNDLKDNHIDKLFAEYPGLFQYYRSGDHELVIPPQKKGDPPSKICFRYAETESEVKRKFMGPEFMDMFIDQAEQFNENEHAIMRTCRRWPGKSSHACKSIYFFNPGGPGATFLKRIFYDREFLSNEAAGDYAFIQACGWDNVEWARSALIEDGLTPEQYYGWDDTTRFNYFITRTQYGGDLNGLKPSLRQGYLLGDFSSFAGQYFDGWPQWIDAKNPTPAVRELKIESWHPKWIAIDWGLQHCAAVTWMAQCDGTSYQYRELVENRNSPRVLAQKIIDHSRGRDGEQENPDSVYLSPDAFADREDRETIADQIGAILMAAGFPRPRKADNDRISGWMLMYDMLRDGQCVIDPRCTKTIDIIPMLSEDPGKDGDLIKIDGDDPADSLRYALKSRFGKRPKPRAVQLEGVLADTQKRLSSRSLSEQYTNMFLAQKRFEDNWKRNHQNGVRAHRPWRQLQA